MPIIGRPIAARRLTSCRSSAAAAASVSNASVLTLLRLRRPCALLWTNLDELMVVYPGEKRYTLAKGVEVVPLAEMVRAKGIAIGACPVLRQCVVARPGPVLLCSPWPGPVLSAHVRGPICSILAWCRRSRVDQGYCKRY